MVRRLFTAGGFVIGLAMLNIALNRIISDIRLHNTGEGESSVLSIQ